MPAFSLPGTSIGTKEAEEYLSARAEGIGRKAASSSLRAMGVGKRYPKQLERMFFRAVSQAKALFSLSFVDPRLPPLQWVQELLSTAERPLYSLNLYCLSHSYNCLCFCRASIISFAETNAAAAVSHNRGSPAATANRVGS